MRQPDEIESRLEDFERRSKLREVNDTAIQHYRLGAVRALQWVLTADDGPDAGEAT